MADVVDELTQDLENLTYKLVKLVEEQEEYKREIVEDLSIPHQLDPPEANADAGIGPSDPSYFTRYAIGFRHAEIKAVEALARPGGGYPLLGEGHTPISTYRRMREAFRVKHKLNFEPDWYGGGFAFAEQPDYESWIRRPYWTIFEATCLSIGFEPRDLPELPRGVGDPNQSPLVFFWHRYRFIQRGCPTQRRPPESVKPQKFLSWAITIPSLVLPEPLNLLGAKQVTSPPEEKAGTRMHARERQSMATLLTAMAIEHYGYDPAKTHSSIPRQIEDICLRQGLEITSETIRKYLRLGAANLPEASQDD